MEHHPRALQAFRRVEAALTATAHCAPPESRLIEDAADAAARELVAIGQPPEALRELMAHVTRTDLAQERGDLTERLRRAVERTLANCEQERRTPTDPQRAVATTGEFRVTGEFRITGEYRTTGEHAVATAVATAVEPSAAPVAP